MLNVIPATAATRVETSDRGLFWGVLVSLLLHGLVLSLQFGIPGLRPGPGAPLTVHLVPPRAQAEPPAVPAAPAALPASPPAIPSLPPATPVTPTTPMAAVPVAPAPAAPPPEQVRHQGFALVDPARRGPVPEPAPAPPAVRPPRPARRHRRMRAPATRDGLHTKVIAQDAHKDDSFAVPPAASEPVPDLDAGAKMAEVQVNPAEPDTAQARASDPVPDAAPAEPEAPSEEEQQAQRERLAEQREQERAARRAAEDQALQAAAEIDARRAAEQQARALAQQAARYDDELVSRQRQLEDAQRQAAAQQLAEQQRVQAEQARAQQLAEQQRIQAEQARAQQLAEQQRIQAEQLARDQAGQARQAERLALRDQAGPQRDSGIGTGGAAPGNSGLDGIGRGTGALPRAALESPLATRARDLLRGIDIDKPLPQAVRRAEDARRNLRRALADAVKRDVPLRMYIDSVRQKIERNAIVSPSHLAADVVRIFPIVSITVRSDGSIEDVTIVRSSGRADIDEVVRRIVHLNARYAAFPPNVAANYDVVELRRVWSFAGDLRLLEEMR